MSKMRTHHMCCDIRGLLNNNNTPNSLKGMFSDDNGNPVSDREAREYLYDCIAKGWRVIPMGDCPTFDYQKGCQCHKMEKQNEM